MNLPNPVIRSHYANGFIKQYVRDHLILHGQYILCERDVKTFTECELHHNASLVLRAS
jgi:hypothetical protein